MRAAYVCPDVIPLDDIVGAGNDPQAGRVAGDHVAVRGISSADPVTVGTVPDANAGIVRHCDVARRGYPEVIPRDDVAPFLTQIDGVAGEIGHGQAAHSAVAGSDRQAIGRPQAVRVQFDQQNSIASEFERVGFGSGLSVAVDGDRVGDLRELGKYLDRLNTRAGDIKLDAVGAGCVIRVHVRCLGRRSKRDCAARCFCTRTRVNRGLVESRIDNVCRQRQPLLQGFELSQKRVALASVFFRASVECT
jgi:hypothetical protein